MLPNTPSPEEIVLAIAALETPMWGGTPFPVLYRTVMGDGDVESSLRPSDLLHVIDRMHRERAGVELVERTEDGTLTPLSEDRLAEFADSYDAWLTGATEDPRVDEEEVGVVVREDEHAVPWGGPHWEILNDYRAPSVTIKATSRAEAEEAFKFIEVPEGFVIAGTDWREGVIVSFRSGRHADAGVEVSIGLAPAP